MPQAWQGPLGRLGFVVRPLFPGVPRALGLESMDLDQMTWSGCQCRIKPKAGHSLRLLEGIPFASRAGTVQAGPNQPRKEDDHGRSGDPSHATVQSFTLDNRQGPIWGSRGRRFKSCQPDQRFERELGHQRSLSRSLDQG
jgi:hypothetical protein